MPNMKNKAVLISINPEWCELIASGEKTIELRKTKPKLKPPFKCYIYMTKDKKQQYGSGKVIGEFVCDCILSHCEMANADIAEQQGFVHREKILSYSKGQEVYGWHISDLVIYDNPKALQQFNRYCNNCSFPILPFQVPPCDNCPSRELTHPPQSWCYVEEQTRSEQNAKM